MGQNQTAFKTMSELQCVLHGVQGIADRLTSESYVEHAEAETLMAQGVAVGLLKGMMQCIVARPSVDGRQGWRLVGYYV